MNLEINEEEYCFLHAILADFAYISSKNEQTAKHSEDREYYNNKACQARALSKKLRDARIRELAFND